MVEVRRGKSQQGVKVVRERRAFWLIDEHRDHLSFIMQVDQCICFDVPFARLLRLHQDEGLDLEGLKARTRCCRGCGLCEPYVKLTLLTGRTEWPVLHEDEVNRRLAAAEG